MSAPLVDGPKDARRLRRAPLYLLIFLAFFAGIAVLVRRMIPMPAHYDLQDKLRYFEEHKDEFDLVFVGSSATFRNYVPTVVDQGLRAEGLEVTSFNFGVVGFRSFETDYLVRWILDLEPERLKWLVLEPPPFEPPFDYTTFQKEKTELAVHSHTPEETALILRSVWLAADVDDEGREREPRWDAALRHLKLCGMNIGNIGRGPSALTQTLARDPDWVAPEWLAVDRGFEAVEDRPGFREPTPRPFADEAAYRATALEFDAKNRAGADLSTYNYAALRRQVEVIRDAGVEPIYCVSPMLHALPRILALDEEGELPNLLAFHLPKSFANLFAPEKRIDLTHLRREGAHEFSRFLAPRLAEVMKRTAP